ncbi:MAG: hypothetical protein ACJ8CB_34760 [Ktedonobacteraceae bacterium]
MIDPELYLDGSPPDFLAHQGCHYISGACPGSKCSGTPGGCQVDFILLRFQRACLKPRSKQGRYDARSCLFG